ncbi:MAG: polysaccharide biosynthesis protein [Deltaproteobacteria bacterium]|nr:polysaccharide biosynthesis protein [Deltaproteobacteria bacterium]
MRVRRLLQALRIAIDIAVLALAYASAWALRFEGAIPSEHKHRLVLTLPYVVVLQTVLLFGSGVPRIAWRYVGFRDGLRIVKVAAGVTAVLLAVRVVVGTVQESYPMLRHALIPSGVILIDGLLLMSGLAGLRVARRFLSEHGEANRQSGPSHRSVRAPLKTLLVGAGRAGALAAQEINKRSDIGILAVGFVDDDPLKLGSLIHSIPVLGSIEELPAIARREDIRQVLITIADLPGKRVRRIRELCEAAEISVKVVPSMSEIVGGRLNLSRMRDVAIEDLLRRSPVVLESDAVNAVVNGRTVLVSGAGGSIGSELCRQICRFAPRQLVLVERSENALFHIDRELRERLVDSEIEIVPFVADIGDEKRIERIFSSMKPNVVFHAAAHKHVPMMELNVAEAAKNNVLGTKLLADAADRHGVGEFVMISTDKAVNPSSVMGVTKRMAEVYVQAISQRSRTRFVAVRFGNVLGSNGSVVPIFQEQIRRGGPVTVTHPEMRRYFMTIPEASQLVVQAAALGRGGEIFVLDMGEPVRIVDLATDLIELSGLRPGEDIEVVFAGVRPGEKLFEELATDDERTDATRHPKIFIGRIRPHEWSVVAASLREIEAAVSSGDDAAVRRALREAIPEYKPPGGVETTSEPAATLPTYLERAEAELT